VIGTATIVSGYLAITARHVLEDIVTRFGAEKRDEKNFEVSNYVIRLYQILPGPKYAIWQVFSAWPCINTDIAFLHLGLFKYSGSKAPSSWKTPSLKVGLPSLGEPVVGFGYHSSSVKVTPKSDGYHLDLNDEPTATTGEIEDVLPSGNPSGRFTFPCFRVNARIDGGMSGGPVIDKDGSVCGIISGTYGNVDGSDISYVLILWPMLRTVISANRAGSYPRDTQYPVIDLALDGLMHVEDLNKLDPKLFPGRTLPPR